MEPALHGSMCVHFGSLGKIGFWCSLIISLQAKTCSCSLHATTCTSPSTNSTNYYLLVIMHQNEDIDHILGRRRNTKQPAATAAAVSQTAATVSQISKQA